MEEETEYGFAFEDAGFGVGQRIIAIAEMRWHRTSIRTAPAASIADASQSVIFFDESGEVEYVIDANDSLTFYTRQLSTGRVASVTANADASGVTLQWPTATADKTGTEPYLSGFSGRYGDGGSHNRHHSRCPRPDHDRDRTRRHQIVDRSLDSRLGIHRTGVDNAQELQLLSKPCFRT